MYSVWSSNFAFNSFAVHKWENDIGSIVKSLFTKTTLNIILNTKVLHTGNTYLVNYEKYRSECIAIVSILVSI